MMIFHISNTKLLDLEETSVSFFCFYVAGKILLFSLFFAFSLFSGKVKKGVVLLIRIFKSPHPKTFNIFS